MMVYLDYAATTPMAAEVIQVYEEIATTYYGNANSLHTKGTNASNVLTSAIHTLRHTIKEIETSVHLTRSGTEANQHALNELLKINHYQGHILTCRTEHPSLRQHLEHLVQIHPGLRIEDVPADGQGQVHPFEVEKRLRSDTILATFAHVQHEIGTIRDITAIGNVLAQAKVPFHSDCVQSYGKIPIPVKESGLKAISTAAHKIHGPKALGAVFFPTSVQATDEIPTGTIDVASIAAFAAAAEIQFKKSEEAITHIRELRAKMIERLPSHFRILGEQQCSPYILGLLLPGIEGQEAMLACDRQGIAIATGSACRSGDHEPSETLLALGNTPDTARTFIRLSFGKDTSMTDIEQTAACLRNIRDDIPTVKRRTANAKSKKIKRGGTSPTDT